MASTTKTVASSHSGWSSGDGRTWNNDTCRTVSNSTAKYYTYTYSHNIPANALVDGVRVRPIIGWTQGSTNNITSYVQLTNGTTLIGNSKSCATTVDVAGCSDSPLFSKGGSTDQWGCTDAQIKASNLGVAYWAGASNGGSGYVDGAEVVIYWHYPVGEPTRRASVTACEVGDVTRRSEVTATAPTTEDITRRAEVGATEVEDLTREASVTIGNLGYTRRASLNVAREVGGIESRYRSVATSHSGWDSGDGRYYNNGTCRTEADTDYYYVYGYGFNFDGAEKIVGIEVKFLCSYGAVGDWPIDIYLCNTTTTFGTHKDEVAKATGTCGTAPIQTTGGSSDKWGSSDDTKITASDFGIAVDVDVGGPADSVYLDGHRVEIFYYATTPVRRAEVTIPVIEDKTRRASVIVAEVAEPTRRSWMAAQDRDEALKSANAEAGIAAGTNWSDLFNYEYNDGNCFYKTNTLNPTTSYNFSHTYGTNNRVVAVGVEVEVHWCSQVESEGTLQLTTGLSTLEGNSRNVVVPFGTAGSCSQKVYAKFGSNHDKWGLTQAELDDWAVDDTKGVRFTPTNLESTDLSIDGFRITIYYFDEEDENRRATLDVAVTKEEIREAVVYPVVTKEETRRASVLPAFQEDVTRRSEVLPAFEDEVTRRSTLSIAVSKEETRRAVVGSATGKEETRRASVSPTFVEQPTRRAEVLPLFEVDDTRRAALNVTADEDITRRAKVTVGKEKEATRRASVFCMPVDATRRASVNVVRIKGQTETKISTIGTTHSGWNTGDGRKYDDNTCRSLTIGPSGTYYVYGFGLDLKSDDQVEGVEVKHMTTTTGSVLVEPTLQLCVATTKKGASKEDPAVPDGASCGAGTERTHGGSSDTWSCSNADITDSDFGVAIDATLSVGMVQEDGFRVQVWYTSGDTIRRATVTASVVKEETRRASVDVVRGEDHTRRAVVYHTAVVNVTRRSEVFACFLGDDTRRASVSVTDSWESRRRAVVSVTLATNVVRRAVLNVKQSILLEHPARRAIVDVVPKDGETTRRASLYIPPFYTIEYTRRAKLSSYRVPETRRAIIHVNLGWLYGDDERRGAVFATRGWYTRRATVTVIDHVGDVARRAILSVAITSETVRRALIDPYVFFIINDEERRAVVLVEDNNNRRATVTVSNAGYTRRATVYARVFMLIEHSVRRAVVTPQPDHMRRAIVSVAITLETARRASVNSAVTKDSARRAVVVPQPDHFRRAVVSVARTRDRTRRSKVSAYSGIKESVRRSRVTSLDIIPEDHTRKANITVAISRDKLRRSKVSAYSGTKEEVRKCGLTVYREPWFIGDDERRAIITVQADHMRRATVNVVRTGEVYRRASITVVGTDVVRRAKVTIGIIAYIIGDDERRAVVYVEVSSYTRRAVVAHVALKEPVRRSSLVVLGTPEITRRARVKAFTRWFYAWPGRRATVSPVIAEEYTRRAKVFQLMVGEETRRATLQGSVQADITRSAILYVFKLVDITRRAKVTSTQKPRIKLGIHVYEL